jgi:apolipoprotein N-acyltransferase
VSLRLVSGERWPYGVGVADPLAFARALGAPVRPSRAAEYARACAAMPRSRLAHPAAKFVLLPLLLAMPAFRLHQHIAYGSSFGEVYAFGLAAYLQGFALWWAAWAIGIVLCATVLRAAVEAGTLAALLLRPAASTEVRRWLERGALATLYLGVPAWLLLRLG